MIESVIDNNGFRLNVGIVLINRKGQVFWGHRVRSRHAWQFPQGGLLPKEKPIVGMYRELLEEVGLNAKDVTCLGESCDWYNYYLPKNRRRLENSHNFCVGQRQKWFLLRLESQDSQIHLDHSSQPEFDTWRWVEYWYPIKHIIFFKRNVYRSVLKEFEELIVDA